VTPRHLLLELLERLAAASTGIVRIPADEASSWPVELPAALEASGLLEPSTPLESVTCPGCDEACLMPVEIRAHSDGRRGSAFVACDRRDDIGLVPLRPDQIRCWQLSGAAAARGLAAALQLPEPRQPIPPLQCWTLGTLELLTGAITVHFSLVPLDQELAPRLHGVGDAGRSHLLLLPPRMLCPSLPANVRAVDLGEVLDWNGRGISLSATALLSRIGSPVALSRPPFLFRRDGDGIWNIRFEGQDCPSMRDLVGLRHLRHLLQNPGRPMSARELLTLNGAPNAGIATDTESEVSALVQQGLDIRHRDLTGPTLDEQARRAYQKRIREIDRLLEEAPLAQPRRDQLERERDALVSEVMQAHGFQGRPRGTSDDERNRISVTNAIRRTVSDLGRRCPRLGVHLKQSIKTGQTLMYHPAEPVSWMF
jgi:hypothetical protein